MRRLAATALVLAALALAWPSLALAHDQPETKQSRWVMADWMMDTFFIFSGLAVLAFLLAWKAGHFQELDRQGGDADDIDERAGHGPVEDLANVALGCGLADHRDAERAGEVAQALAQGRSPGAIGITPVEDAID